MSPYLILALSIETVEISGILQRDGSVLSNKGVQRELWS